MSAAIFLIGGGGHGRVVLAAALSAGLRVTGILDPGLRVGDSLLGVPVLGGDEYLASVDTGPVRWLSGMGANPSTEARRRLFEKLQSRFGIIGVTHPSAVIERECEIGAGVQLMAGCVIQVGAAIGGNSVVNTGASIDHDCRIEPHSFVGPGAVLSGQVSVGEGAFVGAGAVVVPGLRIGRGAIVGAGAVVISNVPDNAIVAGNPARQLSGATSD